MIHEAGHILLTKILFAILAFFYTHSVWQFFLLKSQIAEIVVVENQCSLCVSFSLFIHIVKTNLN